MSVFIAVLLTIAKTRKQSKCPLMSEQIKKVCVGGGGTIQPKKNKEILPFETIWMNLKSIMLSEVKLEGK